MEEFLETYSLQKLSDEQVEDPNRAMMNKEVKTQEQKQEN